MNSNSILKKCIVVILILVIPSLQSFNFRKSFATSLPDEKQTGMSFAAWWSGAYSSPEADQALIELREDGADWISLIVTGYQDTIDSTSIYTSTATPTDEDLLHVINLAHSLGMYVMLNPT